MKTVDFTVVSLNPNQEGYTDTILANLLVSLTLKNPDVFTRAGWLSDEDIASVAAAFVSRNTIEGFIGDDLEIRSKLLFRMLLQEFTKSVGITLGQTDFEPEVGEHCRGIMEAIEND